MTLLYDVFEQFSIESSYSDVDGLFFFYLFWSFAALHDDWPAIRFMYKLRYLEFISRLYEGSSPKLCDWGAKYEYDFFYDTFYIFIFVLVCTYEAILLM